MAIYHLSTKPVKRSSGRSATASAAYRAGAEITDKRTGLTHDYTKRSGVVMTECFAMQGSDKVRLDRSQLWNAAEAAENRKDGRTAREVVINLPHELNEAQRSKLVDDFAQSLAKKYDCGVDYAIHLPDKQGDQRNHHAHIMMTTREIDLEQGIQLGNKTPLELSNRKLAELGKPKTQEQITQMREAWAQMTNNHLKQYGIDASIDHRSHKERGLVAKPTIKLGWQASAMERRGIETDKGDLNREIRADNALRHKLTLELAGFDEAQKQVEAMKQQARDYTSGTENFKSEYEEYKRQQQLAREQEQQRIAKNDIDRNHDRGLER